VDKEKIVPISKIYVFAVWPIAGVLLLVYALINFNNWGTGISIISILVAIFLIVYGGWALSRAYKR